MVTYSIKDMERLSNVKAHTIRIWEQRYHLFTPERTETNIRCYNDDQLRKLLNVCTLIENGFKISHIAKLNDDQIAAAIDSVLNNIQPGDDEFVGMVNKALFAASVYDEAAFEEVFNRCREKAGITDCYLKLIYPLLIRTGLMWSKEEVIPAQEHFLSNLIRRKLFAEIDSLELPAASDQTWILFLHEQEKHEIGLLFASFVLRSMGKKVIYLGQEVPFENLTGVIADCRPTHLYTFFVRNYPPEEVKSLLKRLACDYPDLAICVSGRQDILEELPEGKTMVPVNTLQSLVSIINNQSTC